MKFCLLRKPRAVYFTHWILALMDSLLALVMWCLRRALTDPPRLPLRDYRNLRRWIGVESGCERSDR
jgi:hypothetical protein